MFSMDLRLGEVRFGAWGLMFGALRSLFGAFGVIVEVLGVLSAKVCR